MSLFLSPAPHPQAVSEFGCLTWEIPPHCHTPLRSQVFCLLFLLGWTEGHSRRKKIKGGVWREKAAGGPDLWAPQNVGEGLCLTMPQPPPVKVYFVFSAWWLVWINSLAWKVKDMVSFMSWSIWLAQGCPGQDPRKSRRPGQSPSRALSAASGGSLSCPPCSPRSPRAEWPVCLNPPGAPFQSRQAEPVAWHKLFHFKSCPAPIWEAQAWPGEEPWGFHRPWNQVVLSNKKQNSI